jgi:hypothetical protein
VQSSHMGRARFLARPSDNIVTHWRRCYDLQVVKDQKGKGASPRQRSKKQAWDCAAPRHDDLDTNG